MVPVQVGDKDVVDTGQGYPLLPEPDLGTLSAVDQKKPLIYFEQMSGGKTI